MTPIGYHAMRMRWCRIALWNFVRRWLAYFFAGAAIVVLGMSGGVADAISTLQALCAWLVLPLFLAVNEPVWILPAVAVQALFGAGLVWGMRPLLWPARWAVAERALPLTRRALLLSDGRVVPLGLLPWALLCGIGAQALVASRAPWLQPARAVSALIFALLASVALGVGLLQWSRRPRVAVATGRSADLPSSSGRLVAAPSGWVARAEWPMALLWWPLWRGPAKRSGHALLLGSIALCAPAVGVWRWPDAAAWCLAAYALGALLVVTRVAGLARLELAPLLHACAPLPLARHSIERARDAVALTPLVPAGVLLLTSLPSSGVRPAVLVAYLIACVMSCAFEARSTAPDMGAKASRWLFCLTLLLALASEVTR